MERDYQEIIQFLDSMKDQLNHMSQHQEQLTLNVDEFIHTITPFMTTIQEQQSLILNHSTSEKIRDQEIDTSIKSSDETHSYDHFVEETKKSIMTIVKQMDMVIKANGELKEEIRSFSSPKGPFVSIFRSLPANYPVQSLFVSGTSIHVTRFLSINKENDIAHFTDETELKAVDCNKIDGVSWQKEDVTLNFE
jgi:hypothetical protein